MLSRRGFFGALAALAVAPRLRLPPLVPVPTGLAAIVAELPPGTAVAGINRATFTFWRNQAYTNSPTALVFDQLQGALHG